MSIIALMLLIGTPVTVATVEPVWAGTVEVSAYTASIEETDDTPTIMASGRKVYEGAVACPRDWEFGTQVELEGVGVFTCEDRMNIRYTNNVDIFMWSQYDAVNWGRQVINYKII